MKKNKTPPVLQRSLSIYSLVGALQSVFWFFVLPDLCKSIWPSVFGRFSPQVAEVLVWAITAPYFIIYALISLTLYLLQWDFFEQFKISMDPWPWRDKRETVRQSFWRLTYKSIYYDFVNIFIFIPCFVYIKTRLFPDRSMSFSIDEWPTYYESFRDITLMVVLHEFGFYSTHRVLHAVPTLYRYHKIHHEYKQNNVLAAQHFHFVDFTLSIAIPLLLCTIIIKPHSFTQVQAGLWIFTANLDDHLGYAFPFSPVRWFPLSAGTDAHEFHHSINMGCYGSKLSIWDWVFGTDQVYEEWRKKRYNLDD